MRVFVGFGYNERESWIETQVFPILQNMGFVVPPLEKSLQLEILSVPTLGRVQTPGVENASIHYSSIRQEERSKRN